MSLKNLPAGRNLPKDINVVIEISAYTGPIKYEVNDEGVLFVDRFINTAMVYPCNYGFVPQTLAGDGDPLDALVVTPQPLYPCSVIRCRPIGLLAMTDEGGQDEKLVCVPIDKITLLYSGITNANELPATLLQQVAHFFTHYKDLDKGKWVNVGDWQDAKAAEQLVQVCADHYQAQKQATASA